MKKIQLKGGGIILSLGLSIRSCQPHGGAMRSQGVKACGFCCLGTINVCAYLMLQTGLIISGQHCCRACPSAARLKANAQAFCQAL